MHHSHYIMHDGRCHTNVRVGPAQSGGAKTIPSSQVIVSTVDRTQEKHDLTDIPNTTVTVTSIQPSQVRLTCQREGPCCKRGTDASCSTEELRTNSSLAEEKDH
jgi:hypothetical protein